MKALVLLFLFQTPYSPEKPLDINRASLEEISGLPMALEAGKAESVYKWIQTRGPLSSIYDLAEIPGIDAGDLARWKPLIRISPPREVLNFSERAEEIRAKGAAEEGPLEFAFDEWIYLLSDPINVNRASIDELLSLDRVTLIDAVAVKRQLRYYDYRDLRDLRRAPGLSYYGYRNMRDFVVFREIRPRTPRGWFHLDLGYTSSLYTEGSELRDRITELEDTSGTSGLRDDLLEEGWTEDQVSALLDRLGDERSEIASLTPSPYFRAKSAMAFLEGYKVGWMYERSPYRGEPVYKGYASVNKMGILDRLIVGNYRLTLGQSLIMDNTDEQRDRLYDRPRGLYGDLTSGRGFDLFGAATELRLGLFHPLFFYSNTDRDAVPKRDGSVNFHFVGTYVPEAFRDRFNEQTYGASLRFDLPSPFPLGTQVAYNFLEMRYDSKIDPDFREMDLPFDQDSLAGDPSFTWISGEKKRFHGLEFRTVVHPVSFEGELALEDGGGYAMLLKGRLQESTFYVNWLFRHYENDYTNPYDRAFMEDTRFEDTPMEREYRLIDPIYADLSEYPIPKPETGFYLETRYQLFRQILIPRAYIDVWRDNTEGLWNYRIQAEVEFRPIFPLRFRFKEKIQKRMNLRDLGQTQSLTKETTFRAYVLLPGYNFIGIEARYGNVDLAPRESYPSAAIRGGLVSLTWDHNFSENFEMRTGAIVWRTEGMSQWAFEDTEIDFLYGEGTKYYATFLERLSRNLGLKLKIRIKDTDFPHTGLYSEGYVRADGEPITMDFEEVESLYSIYFGLDYNF